MCQTVAVLNDRVFLHISKQEQRSLTPSSGRQTPSWYHGTVSFISQTALGAIEAAERN